MSMMFIDISIIKGVCRLNFLCFSVPYFLFLCFFPTFALQIFPVRLNKCPVCSGPPAGCNLNQIIIYAKGKNKLQREEAF
jgi:hypothetical protein